MSFLTSWEMEEEVVMEAVVTTVMPMMGAQQVRMGLNSCNTLTVYTVVLPRVD